MKAPIRNIILTAVLALTGTANATEIVPGELVPMQAHTVAMDGYTAVVYYTVLSNGDFQVVTSAGPDAGVEGEMIQRIEIVDPGQTVHYTLHTAAGKSTQFQFTAGDGALVVASR